MRTRRQNRERRTRRDELRSHASRTRQVRRQPQRLAADSTALGMVAAHRLRPAVCQRSGPVQAKHHRRRSLRMAGVKDQGRDRRSVGAARVRRAEDQGRRGARAVLPASSRGPQVNVELAFRAGALALAVALAVAPYWPQIRAAASRALEAAKVSVLTCLILPNDIT